MTLLVSWNVAGRVRSAPAQAVALAEQHADVLALQELRVTSLGAWRAALRAAGFEHVVSTLDERDLLVRMPPDRRLGVLLASREPLEPVDPPPEVPWPERLLVARVHFDGKPVELYNLHSPISSKRDQVKVRTLEAVTAQLAESSELPRVLCGDLNTPQYESRGYSRRDRSWLYPNGRMGYRLDHILVRGLEIEACDYRHELRERRLSDHSAIWADLHQFLSSR